MNNDCSFGPVSTLPGYISKTYGEDCQNHAGRLATRRVQGETDSMGCEYIFMCDDCFALYQNRNKSRDTSGQCDWCGSHAAERRPRRDYDEGLSGRVYQVCPECISRDTERARAEYEDMARYEYDDCDDCDCDNE